MVIAALVIMLFLLGFGFMVFTHAHREIHPMNRKVGTWISVIIIAFTSLMVLYLGGYVLTQGIFMGKNPLSLGFGPVAKMFYIMDQASKRNDALEKSLLDINTILQKQAMQKASSRELELKLELQKFKKELTSLKTVIAKQAKPKVVKSYSKKKPTYRRTYTRKRTVKRASTKKVVTNLVGYDPSKYTSANEPLVVIPSAAD